MNQRLVILSPVAFTHQKLLGCLAGPQRSFFILGDFSQAFSIDFFNTANSVGQSNETKAIEERQALRREDHKALGVQLGLQDHCFNIILLDILEYECISKLNLKDLCSLRETSKFFLKTVDQLPLSVERVIVYNTIHTTSFGFDEEDWEKCFDVKVLPRVLLPAHILSILKSPNEKVDGKSVFQTCLLHFQPHQVFSNQTNILEDYSLGLLKRLVKHPGAKFFTKKVYEGIICNELHPENKKWVLEVKAHGSYWVLRSKNLHEKNESYETQVHRGPQNHSFGNILELTTSEYVHYFKSDQIQLTRKQTSSTSLYFRNGPRESLRIRSEEKFEMVEQDGTISYVTYTVGELQRGNGLRISAAKTSDCVDNLGVTYVQRF